MLEVKHLSKIYESNGRKVEAINDLSFRVEDKQFIALVGPSGCGKTTFLKIAAGLLEKTEGEILLDGKEISGPGQDRGMVFQNFTLFPWLTVRKNIGFGATLREVNSAEKQRIVEHYLRVTGLTEFADFYPKDLSGGMQQRAAIGRTLANNPKVLLMDEPFGSRDTQTRSQMQEFLTKLWESDHQTIVFVTHDVNEAIFLADKVCVLSRRPTKIKTVYDVPFSRPRAHEIKHAPEFFAFASKIAKELEE